MQKTSRKKQPWLFIIGGLSISLLNFIVFWLYINVDTVISTFDVGTLGDPFFYYKDMFHKVILGEEVQGAFGHTMISIVINVILLPLALITAYAFYKRVYGEKIYRVVFYLPSIIAITTLAMSFRELFLVNEITWKGENYELIGPVARLLKALGYEKSISMNVSSSAPGQFAYDNFWSLTIFFCIFVGLGTNVVLMCGAMMRIPVDITEALRIDGCGFFRELTNVTLPMIMPTITTWLIMIVTSVFAFSITPMLLGGFGPENVVGSAPGQERVMTIPLFIYANIVAAKGDPSVAMKSAQALGVMFSLIIMPIVLLTRWLCEKFTPDISY